MPISPNLVANISDIIGYHKITPVKGALEKKITLKIELWQQKDIRCLQINIKLTLVYINELSA